MTGSPLEVTIVGDIDEADAVIEAGATFGALPPRRAAPVSRPDAWFLRFPEHPPALIHAFHEGPPEKAAVAAVWPLYIAEPARRREEYALSLAARVYQEALLRRIRGDLGKAYSPSASTEMPDHGDQGYMVAQAEVGAADVEQTRTEMIAIAGKIARGEFTDQDVETVRKPLLAAMAQRLDSNEMLAGAIHTDIGDEHPMQDLRDMPAAYASITPAEVRKAAADWMSRPPIVVVVTGKAPPAAAPSGTPPQGAKAPEAKP
jgi:zinc protease